MIIDARMIAVAGLMFGRRCWFDSTSECQWRLVRGVLTLWHVILETSRTRQDLPSLTEVNSWPLLFTPLDRRQ